jgi:hypothetical protein
MKEDRSKKCLRSLTAFVPLLLLIALAGCGAGAAAGGSQSDVINAQEIAQYGDVGDLEALIDRARPRWFQTDRIRSFNLGSAILVYDGNTLLGNREVLREISPQGIQEIRWLNSAQAGTLPGAGSQHIEGAVVITRR